MTDRELMQQALEALEMWCKGPHDSVTRRGANTRSSVAIAALRERLAQPEQELVMKRIKTWSERCEEHPDHQQGMISEGMIRARMQEEIDELRQALETEQEPVVGEYATCLEDGERVLIASVLPVGYGGNKTRTVRVVWPDGMDGVYTMFQFARLFSPVGELTTPPRREWVGLTEAEKVNVAIDCGCADVAWMDFADTIEAKLKEKNA